MPPAALQILPEGIVQLPGTPGIDQDHDLHARAAAASHQVLRNSLPGRRRRQRCTSRARCRTWPGRWRRTWRGRLVSVLEKPDDVVMIEEPDRARCTVRSENWRNRAAWSHGSRTASSVVIRSRRYNPPSPSCPCGANGRPSSISHGKGRWRARASLRSSPVPVTEMTISMEV